jgi:hypothetical protein
MTLAYGGFTNQGQVIGILMLDTNFQDRSAVDRYQRD